MRWILVAFALFAAAPASAVPFTQVVYWFGGAGGGSTIINPEDPVTANHAFADATASIAGWADYGTLKSTARSLANTTASVTSSWSDAATIDAGALNGQIGWVTVGLDYNWQLRGQGNASYRVDVLTNLFVAGHFWTIRERRAQSCSLLSCTIIEDTGRVLTTGVPGHPLVTSEAPFSRLVVTVPIEFGESFNLGADLVAFGQSNEYDDGRVVLLSNTMVDAGNSVYWGGILSVQDATGKDVDYSLRSLSGTDYSRSFTPAQADPTVPEPSIGLLLLSGLAAAAVRRKRGRTS